MTGTEDIAAIQSCFACGESSAALLAADMESRSFGHRDAVAHGGDRSAHFFLILQGAVVAEIFGIDGQQAQLAKHGPGEIFGAYPVEAVHRTDLTAVGNTRLLAIPVRRLAELAAGHAEIANGIATLMARQLDLVLDRMAARIGLSATGRFYKALLQLADNDGRICPAPVVAALALSVHTTRETASRALAAVVRRGIVERNDNGLTVVSRRMLEELIV
jgi:CRP/FNR family transcriptional regulator, cyclic AMP receptor protein